MANRTKELLDEFDETLEVVPSKYIYYMGMFINFLVDKIEKLENPVIEVQIPVKGGDTNGNSEEKQSETPQR